MNFTSFLAVGLEDQLLGPLGLTAALIIAITFVARELVKFVREYIADLKTAKEVGDEQLKLALEGWQAQTAANQTLAEAQEARNRDDELRHRLAEAKKP